jgi:hypothetical protein
MMDTYLLNKLSPEARDKVIRLEAEFRECEEEIALIDNLLENNPRGML